MHLIFSIPTLIVLIVLIGFSFFFSAAETSLIAISKIKARHMVNRGIRKAHIVVRLITKLDRVVSAILIGNNFANIAISAIVTAVCVGIFQPPWGVIIATLSTAVFVMSICEILPKTIAIRYSERVALFCAPFLELFIGVFAPLVNFFSNITNFILKLFGAEPDKRSPLITEEELRLLIEIGKEEGVLSDEERKMLHRIFEFGDTKVAEVMVGKDKIVAIDKSSDAEKLLDILVEEGHARIPVYDGSIDSIIGVIYARDLLYIWRNKGLVVLPDLIHPVHYVPAGKRVNELLREFQTKRIQIAVVVDDNRKTLGVVTLEDLIEEIVGEIDEEK